MKVLLILVDGMRPDAIDSLPRVKSLIEKASYTMKATTVMPSMTLPCHVSLFHSVDPSRHGTTTNTYAPQVRPINGLCEVLKQAGKKSAFFYDWEQLRDVSRPSSLAFSQFCSGKSLGYPDACNISTDRAIELLSKSSMDFTFLYLGYPDAAGHSNGWMSQEYMDAIENSFDNIDRVLGVLPDDYTVIITADHGGHERTHGLAIKEDMLIPMIIIGKDFSPCTEIEQANIKDIAPTIAKLLGVEPDEEWEGHSLI